MRLPWDKRSSTLAAELGDLGAETGMDGEVACSLKEESFLT